ncbi:hypothetical protein BDY21DRAFT_352408 [Lineolata rhizophorae]|uniref:DUF2461 domain-containing protein n=1 Tax=Lineolata rhizophorae TaxID=578093 RepID=A0A6A6NSF0_9PEZI|nr:hypothetical protein BDY21DRAFT_352408 [Lineolata rhizophorae]
MARRSARQSENLALRGRAKRPLSPEAQTQSRKARQTANPGRRSKGAAKSTLQTSGYFEPLPGEAADSASGRSRDGGNTSASASDYDDGDKNPSESDIEELDDSDESTAKPKAKGKKGRRSGTSIKDSGSTKGKELWRPGVKTGLKPGTQLVIKKPKAREAGNTPYRNDTVHPNTLLFLRDLAKNNDREWLKMHDPDYRQALKDFHSFVEALTPKIIEGDETIPELPVKDVVFRIYRDIRFSTDPTPYKTCFSAAWSRTGRKGPYACYYVHIEPQKSFVGGGLWMPDADRLAALRRDIDRKPRKIMRVLTADRMRRAYLDGVGPDEKDVVRAFVGKPTNAETALKTKPKGYDADHENIELLRLRSFTLGSRLGDEELTGPGALDRIMELVVALEPFVTYLNSVVMPDDPDGSSSSSNGSDDGDDEGESAEEDDGEE